MSVNYKVEWPMSLRAPADSLEAKQPDIDNGLDVPDPARYHTLDFMQKEWSLMWPRVWLLAGVIALHIAAAVKHRFVDRDGVWSRMARWPGRG